MAELPLRHTPRARGEDALSDLEDALQACEDLLSGELRLDERAQLPFPLEVAMAHPEHGPWVRRFLAGDPNRPDRMQAARWRVLNTDLPQALRELARRTWPLLEPGEGPRVQPRVSELLSRLARARTAPAPVVTSLAEERSRSLDMARRFLADDPALDETGEVHRWGLFGRGEVRGGVHTRLLACERLGPCRVPLAQAHQAILDAADHDGWRHFPAQRQIARDTASGGLVLQLARGAGWSDHPLVRQTEQDIVASLDDDGLPAPWLGQVPTSELVAGTPDWPVERCPAAAAAALLGLWHLDASAHADRVRLGLGTLAAWVLGKGYLVSPTMSDTVCQLTVLQALRGVEPRRWREAEAVLTDRLLGGGRRSGLLGTPLETALAAPTLAGTGALEWPDITVRALVDSQQADGGWPAEAVRALVLDPASVTSGSRSLVTAACLRALLELEVR